MGKGRGKGKKQSFIAKREEHGNEGDKDSAYRRSGIQQKSLKDEIEEVEEASENIEDWENVKVKNSSAENKRKRKRSVLVKEEIDPVKKENAIRTKRDPDDSKKLAGFRQNGSRRKNKPRRAAEAGVDCVATCKVRFLSDCHDSINLSGQGNYGDGSDDCNCPISQSQHSTQRQPPVLLLRESLDTAYWRRLAIPDTYLAKQASQMTQKWYRWWWW